MNYPFSEIEPKWQSFWLEQKTFASPSVRSKPALVKKPKYYVLDMFPYPSGAGLHVGHPEGYTATDIMARYHRMRGFQVLHPMGWDAFGLPAERYAQKTGVHPRQSTMENIENFRGQLQRLGFSYDWDREINTTDTSYLKWTQWIFLKLFDSFYDHQKDCARPIQMLPIPDEIAREKDAAKKRAFVDRHRLAYVAEMPVNWCEELGTVLANEEVEEWQEKGYQVIQKPMRQWMLRITAYAERLLQDLQLVQWPQGTIELQRNWIGRSEGALIRFAVLPLSPPPTFAPAQHATPAQSAAPAQHAKSRQLEIEVFTTRPDTLYGASFLALAPEHPLVTQITDKKQHALVSAFIAQTAKRKERSRQAEEQQASGVFLGSYAQHPFDEKCKIPIWIADYVMMGYGSGAIMSVPAHDERDFRFAQKYNLPIKRVVMPVGGVMPAELPFVASGISVSSDFLTGLSSVDAKAKMIAELEKKKKGSRKIQYKLRDWIFSRQRYWGEPIPISTNEEGVHMPQWDLPLPLPEPTGFDHQRQSPLAHNTDWLMHDDNSDDADGGPKPKPKSKSKPKLRRETNTMPQWAGSCWYYLRFVDPANEKAVADSQEEQYWLGKTGVDLYVGGKEHAVLHLLYARFWHKFLYDLKVVSQKEPFPRLVHQGIILGEDGRKMSKSLGNVVNPDTVVNAYGADALRCFEMFLGPLEQDKRWSSRGIEGINRFLNRSWRLFMKDGESATGEQTENATGEALGSVPTLGQTGQTGQTMLDANVLKEPAAAHREELLYTLHGTIRQVTEDIESMSFNTAISHLMVFVNTAIRLHKSIGREAGEAFVLLLSPFAPHLAEELWSHLGHKKSLAFEPWPKYNPKYAQRPEKQIVFQVNGKIRGKQDVAKTLTEKELSKMALEHPQVKKYLQTHALQIVKTIVVKDKLVNLVCRPL